MNSTETTYGLLSRPWRLYRAGPRWLVLAGGLVMCLVGPRVHGEVTLTTLVSFTGTNGPNLGNYPSSLVQAADGNFYGTTYSGGAYPGPNRDGAGTVFRMTPAGTLTTLYSFKAGNDAYFPIAGLIQATDGTFYGTTSYGGTSGHGTLFRMAADETPTILHWFGASDGPYPAQVVQGADGNVYGVTTGDGSTVFRITTNGTFTTLHWFQSDEGLYPSRGGLVQGRDGNFYGTTRLGGPGSGGSIGFGTVFRMTPDGAWTCLTSFNGDNGSQPQALVEGADGNFYGATSYGGIGYQEGSSYSGYGTVFRISSDGTLTTLASFNGTNGSCPYSRLVQGSDGNFYGTTWSGGANTNQPRDGGTVFQISPSGTLTTLVSFNGTNGYQSEAGLVQGTDGNFYGATKQGGPGYNGITSSGYGTIFRLRVPGADPLKIQTATKSGSTFTLTWLALSNRSYQVQFTTNLSRTNWNNCGSPVTATNFTATASDSITTDPQRFYRVVLLP